MRHYLQLEDRPEVKVQFDHEEDGRYVIHVYEIVGNGEESHDSHSRLVLRRSEDAKDRINVLKAKMPYPVTNARSHGLRVRKGTLCGRKGVPFS